MIDGNTAALHDHMAREDRAAQARHDARPRAIENLEHRFRDNFSLSSDWLVDALHDCRHRSEAFVKARDAGGLEELGRMVKSIMDVAEIDYIEHNLEKEIDRIVTG